MKTIRNCGDLGEATSLKLLLEGSGVDAFIPDEASAGVAPYLFKTNSGVRLQVADDDVERAEEILSTANAQPSDGDE